jgi:hypothetical protein
MLVVVAAVAVVVVVVVVAAAVAVAAAAAHICKILYGHINKHVRNMFLLDEQWLQRKERIKNTLYMHKYYLN